MPNYIIKPNPDVDEYVLWSTIPDGPVSDVLGRAGMTRFLMFEYYQSHTRSDAEERLDRADQTGTSALWDIGSTQYVRVEEDWLYCDGSVPNARVADLVRALHARDEKTVRSLIDEAGPEPVFNDLVGSLTRILEGESNE